MSSSTDHAWKFDRNSTALQVIAGHDLQGKYAIVTGANTGIGLETARALVSAHCHVVLACRDMKKAGEAVDKLKTEFPNGKAEAMQLDLGSLKNVKQFAEAYLAKDYPLHLLILNAGVLAERHQATADGYESQYQANHLAQMYLTKQLETKLVASAPSRVVIVSSVAIRMVPDKSLTVQSLNEAFFVGDANKYDGSIVYALSKCLNVLFARELHKHVQSRGVSVFVLHPGFIRTNLQSNTDLGKNWLAKLPEDSKKSEKTPEQGAATSVFCAVEKGLEPFSGRYFSDSRVADVPAWLTDDALSKHLWTLSETLVNKKVA